MVDNQRDARLVLRAEDRATKTFGDVSKSVKELTRTLAEQAKAAAAGEGDLAALTATLREIEALGQDLEKQRSAVRAFERIGDSADKAAERVARTTKAYDDYKAKLNDAGKTTDAQAARLTRLGAAVEAATTAQDQQTKRLDAARERLTALGLSSENTAAQLDGIVNTFRELGPAYGQATNAISGFEAAQQRAATASAADAKAQREASAAADTAAKEAEQRAQARFKTQQALANQRAKEEADEAARLARLDRETAEIEQQTAALRQSGETAVAASTNLNRFAQTGEAATMGLTRLAQAVQQIVSPTLSSVQSLDGAIAQIDSAAEVATSKQKVRVSQYQDSLNGLTQAQATLVRQAQNVDAFTRQTAALDKVEAELAQAAQRVEDLGRAAAAAVAPNETLTRELAQANRELEQTGARALAARKSFASMQEGLRGAGIDTGNLTSELNRLETAARKSATVADTLTAKVGGGGKGFLGLKPYELTNLGYQINDVFTSLASGISPVQTLAQQGPQIAQLFPNILVGALRLLPVLLPIGVAFAAIAVNVKRANEEASAIRGFEQIFKLSGDAAGMSAEQFGKAQIALEKVGQSSDNAKGALRAFIDAGLDASSLDTFLATVRQIAVATGEDLPAAAQKYAAALTGGFDQVVALNDVTHTLNDTQLDEIQRLFDAGQAQEARTKVAEIYRAKAQEIADLSKSDWKRATEQLDRAFAGLNTTLRLSQASSAIATAALGAITAKVNQLSDAAGIANIVLKRLFDQQGKGPRAPTPDEQKRIDAANGKAGVSVYGGEAKSFIDGLKKNFKSTSSNGGQKFLRQQQTQLKNSRLLTASERIRVAETDAANAAAEAGATDAEIAQAKLNARKIEQAKLDKEAETRGNKAAAASRKAANAAKAEANAAEARQTKIDGLTRDLENTYQSLGANKTDDPFKAIQAKADIAVRNIRAKFADLAKLGVTQVGGKTQKDFEAQVAAAAALETQQARLKQNEDDVNKLLDQRRIVLAGIEDQVKRGELTPAQGIDTASAAAVQLDQRIASAAKQAYDFAVSLRTATFDPKLETMIAKLAENLRSASNGASMIDIGLQGLQDAQKELDALVARRDEVVKLNEALVKAGLKSPAAAQAAIKAAFDSSRPAILQSADAVQAIIDRLLQLPGLSDEIRARLEGLSTGLVGVRAETKTLDADLVSLKHSIGQAAGASIADFFNEIGTAIAGAIEGGRSLGQVLGDIGNAALNFAASFTKAIAQAIIQLVALKIAKSVLGAGFFHGGGIAGGTPTFRRKVSSDVFLGAVRYHTGGLVGLRPDEVPAILQKGEEVITANDPRHRANGGATPSSPGGDVKVIATLDPTEVTRQALNTNPGQKAVIAVLSANPAAARAALGID